MIGGRRNPKLTLGQRNDLLEIMEDRHGLRRSTLFTTQLPINQWHKAIGDATLADAIIDRLLRNSHKIKRKEESMRKAMSDMADSDHLDWILCLRSRWSDEVIGINQNR